MKLKFEVEVRGWSLKFEVEVSSRDSKQKFDVHVWSPNLILTVGFDVWS